MPSERPLTGGCWVVGQEWCNCEIHSVRVGETSGQPGNERVPADSDLRSLAKWKDQVKVSRTVPERSSLSMLNGLPGRLPEPRRIVRITARSRAWNTLTRLASREHSSLNWLEAVFAPRLAPGEILVPSTCLQTSVSRSLGQESGLACPLRPLTQVNQKQRLSQVH